MTRLVRLALIILGGITAVTVVITGGLDALAGVISGVAVGVALAIDPERP